MRNVLLYLIYWAHQTIKLIKPNAFPGEVCAPQCLSPFSVNYEMEIEGSVDWDHSLFYKPQDEKDHAYPKAYPLL